MPVTVLVALQPFNGGNAPITFDACIEEKDNSMDKRHCLCRLVPFSGTNVVVFAWNSVIGSWVADMLVGHWSTDWPIGLPNADRACRPPSNRQVCYQGRHPVADEVPVGGPVADRVPYLYFLYNSY